MKTGETSPVTLDCLLMIFDISSMMFSDFLYLLCWKQILNIIGKKPRKKLEEALNGNMFPFTTLQPCHLLILDCPFHKIFLTFI